MHVNLNVEIDQPLDAVFPWIADSQRAMKWMTSVSASEILEETPEKVGTTFRERVEENGKWKE